MCINYKLAVLKAVPTKVMFLQLIRQSKAVCTDTAFFGSTFLLLQRSCCAWFFLKKEINFLYVNNVAKVLLIEMMTDCHGNIIENILLS